MGKGFFFTIDSFLAITFISAIILLSFFHMSSVQTSSWSLVDMRVVTNDVLLFLENKGSFDDSFKINASEDEIIVASGRGILGDLNNVSDIYCFELFIFEDGNILNPVLYVLEPSCSMGVSEIFSIERPLVIIKEDIVQNYIVRLKGWKK